MIKMSHDPKPTLMKNKWFLSTIYYTYILSPKF